MTASPQVPLSAAELDAALGPFVDQLITPALVIDLDAVAANLQASLRRFGGPRRWRPHLKTCKQAVVIGAMLDAGLRQFKVATPDELALLLETAAEHPPVDALLAYPAQRASFAALVELARAHPHARLSVLADSPEHLASLAIWAREHELGPATLGVLPDVDLGMHRTGSPPERWRALRSIPAELELRGLHGYEGHIRWTEAELATRGYDQLCGLAAELIAALAPTDPLELVTSGTHSYAHALDHAGLADPRWRHSVSPGTIVLSDRRSHGAAADIGLRQAAFVATRVISLGPGRVTLDAGSKGISPDVPPPNCAVHDHPELVPGGPSEEHLPCRLDPGAAARPLELGQLLWLVPEHVCTTVNLHREAIWVRGGQFAGVGPVGAAGHRPRFGDTRPGPIHS